jgi:hypothetical protein
VSRFVRTLDFASLSVRDLLEARDAYHLHLANLENVVGTAIGRYRIRYTDPDYTDPNAKSDPNDSTPRQLDTSGVTKWSWPCVLVFVSEWATTTDISKTPSQFVPPRLYLPDGRVVPTCVIYAPRKMREESAVPRLVYPSGLVGGGYPVFTDDQGEERVGSVGCLVSDGYYVYALTTRHVIGDPGTPACISDRGVRRRIGIAHKNAKGKVSFDEAYPGWKYVRSIINIDAGLFLVDEVSEWTAQVFGVGRIGELIDLNVDTLNLDLVGLPVIAQGGASGALRGEIHGLFYRYRAVGGFDYIADLLIGPRRGDPTVTTRPGDSGTVWFWDESAEAKPVVGEVPPARVSLSAGVPDHGSQAPSSRRDQTPEVRPLALQWGGHSLLEPGGQGVMQFALASSLANVCRMLDVEIIRDWSIDHSLYWGKVGHYKIGYSACFLSSNGHLDQLLRANAERISVSDAAISNGDMPSASKRDEFIALADVPDLVWRYTRKRDQANHFADMDQPGGKTGKAPTLMQLWESDSKTHTAEAWTEFYDSLSDPPPDKHRGALPFRVRQLYSAMVGFVGRGDVASFICAAGVLAHYVGDACQPLHISHLHHGHEENPEEEAVHSVYETKMLDRFSSEVVTSVNGLLAGRRVTNTIKGGERASDLVVRMMKNTIAALPPEKVIDVFNEVHGRGQVSNMWQKLGKDTMKLMAEGALCLATLWESAWIEGNGDENVAVGDLKTIPEPKLMALYNDKDFVEPRWLKDMTFE